MRWSRRCWRLGISNDSLRGSVVWCCMEYLALIGFHLGVRDGGDGLQNFDELKSS